MLVSIIPRQVRFLIAAKSLKRRVVGCLARMAACIGVRRGEDESRKGSGMLRVMPGTKIFDEGLVGADTQQQQNHPQQTHQMQPLQPPLGDGEGATGEGAASENNQPRTCPSTSFTSNNSLKSVQNSSLNGGDGLERPRAAAGAAAVQEASRAAQSFSSRWISLCVKGINTRFTKEVSTGDTIITPSGAYHVKAVFSDTNMLVSADPQPLPPFSSLHRNESRPLRLARHRARRCSFRLRRKQQPQGNWRGCRRAAEGAGGSCP
ncbi:putative glycerol-3-phosphate acyltransferase [Cyclospora cayetanensis]|uniref:Glycerol-3-phosphate acyltransferase n=1 Tax=Cyclospora cayetanensis TaxID=88456 RepID=A0A1D3CTT9_9EIME|nr:putative glycerol-3-phosphate acyltransferase [Cyclospora cayetanensis]